MNQELLRINAMRRIWMAYFDAYVENNIDPTIQGAVNHVQVEEEIENNYPGDADAEAREELERENTRALQR